MSGAGRGIHHVELSDAALVQRAWTGDTRAYGELVTRYRDRLGRYAMHMLGNREDAEEALQDAFVRAYRSLRRCDDPGRFGPWLFGILVNRCRTLGARRARRERRVVADEAALSSAAVDDPAEQLAWEDHIRWALARLEPRQREAFLLKHVEDLEYGAMTKITGAGISALKMRVKRACEHLRQLLREVERV